MSRKPREQSASGVYHVMLRGINQQAVFEDDEDYERFLLILQDCKTVSHFKLYAYCLMSNHIHLLLRIGPSAESLEQVFKRIGVRYVAWFNHKYRRSGHLFQDRFRSEAVNDDSYLLTVLRYIHQNPVKAGMCAQPEQYRWSSYPNYLSVDGLCDRDELLAMLAADPSQAMKQFKALHKVPVQTECLDIKTERQPDDQEARALLLELCGSDQAAVLSNLPAPARDAAIPALRERGISIRQIVRLTGWSFGIVRSRS